MLPFVRRVRLDLRRELPVRNATVTVLVVPLHERVDLLGGHLEPAGIKHLVQLVLGYSAVFVRVHSFESVQDAKRRSLSQSVPDDLRLFLGIDLRAPQTPVHESGLIPHSVLSARLSRIQPLFFNLVNWRERSCEFGVPERAVPVLVIPGHDQVDLLHAHLRQVQSVHVVLETILDVVPVHVALRMTIQDAEGVEQVEVRTRVHQVQLRLVQVAVQEQLLLQGQEEGVFVLGTQGGFLQGGGLGMGRTIGLSGRGQVCGLFPTPSLFEPSASAHQPPIITLFLLHERIPRAPQRLPHHTLSHEFLRLNGFTELCIVNFAICVIVQSPYYGDDFILGRVVPRGFKEPTQVVRVHIAFIQVIHRTETSIR